MNQQGTTQQNVESGQEVAKRRLSDSAPPSRFSAAYWEPRVFKLAYSYNGAVREVQEFVARISHGGRRERVSLATNTRDEAARRAARLFKVLQAEGWEAALRLFRPDAKAIQHTALTVGRYLALVDEYAPLPPRTQANYAYAIRRIAADICQAKLGKGKNRFDPRGRWRELADRLPLATVTPMAVEDWRLRFRRGHGGNPLADQRASRSANSYLRNARALFSRRILDAMRKHDVRLPAPLPFEGVRLDGKTGSTRYRSTIDAGPLLSSAREDLSEQDPDAYAVILLALGAGLRRSEIDAMQWPAVMPDRGIIRVMTTAQRRVKSEESEGDVQVDAGLFTEMTRTRRSGSTLYVVEPNTEHPRTKAAQIYRAQETFRRVTAWLRAQGVMGTKPLHTLRKEFGSVVAAAGDIHQAQRQLRHAQISTTEQYYADARSRATLPVAKLLSPTQQVEAKK